MRDFGVRHLHQNAGGQARIQVGALHACPVGRERATGSAGLGVVVAQRLHFGRQGFFQALRAGGEHREHFRLAGFARAAAAGVDAGCAVLIVIARCVVVIVARFGEFRCRGVLGRRGLEIGSGAVIFKRVVEAARRRGRRNVLVIEARRALRRTA
ncbi:hypothetical protein D3C85_1106850 [compost metagenome]